jgi:hypothetical protein
MAARLFVPTNHHISSVSKRRLYKNASYPIQSPCCDSSSSTYDLFGNHRLRWQWGRCNRQPYTDAYAHTYSYSYSHTNTDANTNTDAHSNQERKTRRGV